MEFYLNNILLFFNELGVKNLFQRWFGDLISNIK